MQQLKTNKQSMQNYCKTIGALAAATALVAGNAQAAPEYQIHTGYSSLYVFRGVELGQDLGEVGVDVSNEWNGLTVSGGFWAAMFNVDNSSGNNLDNELDLYGEVGKDFGFLTASVGYIYYWNFSSVDGVDDHDQEVYFSVARDFGFASAELTYFWNVDPDTSGNDGYTELSLSKSWELNSCLTLNASTNVGYLIAASNFTASTTKLSLDWAFAEHAKLSPYVLVSIALGEDEATAWYETNNELVVGTILSVGF